MTLLRMVDFVAREAWGLRRERNKHLQTACAFLATVPY